jgi:hypothetical protein
MSSKKEEKPKEFTWGESRWGDGSVWAESKQKK